jgi:hypothetical protein
MPAITTAAQLTAAIQTLVYQGASVVTVTVNGQAVDWDVHILLDNPSMLNALVTQANGTPITVVKKS